MAKTTLAQFSFNRGEIDPALHGRSDWKYYFSSADTMRNLIARPQGGASKRPGLRYVVNALNQQKPSFFIPFIFSTQQSYMLEFGNYQMRILMNGELVVYPPGHAKAGQVVVVTTPYSSDELPLLRHAQTADVMYITISSQPPRILKRYDHWDWRFDEINFGQQLASPSGLRLTVDGKNGARYCVTAIKGTTVQSTASNVVTCTTASGVGIPVPDYNNLSIEQCYHLWTTQYNQIWPPEWDIYSDSTQSRVIQYMQSAIEFSGYYVEYKNGDANDVIYSPDGIKHKFQQGVEAQRCYQTAVDYTNAGYGGVLQTMRNRIRTYVTDYNNNATPTGNSTLAWNGVSGATGYYIFREVKTGSTTTFYYIGTTTGTTFNDNNLAYDSSRGLPVTTNPFDQPGKYPGVCAFSEQRIVYGRTDNQPTTFWGSVVGNYNSFSKHTPIEETDSYEFTLASGEMNAINWIVPMNELLFGTSGGEWKAGGGGAIISPLNVNARVQSWYGCAAMNPVVIGRTVVFVTRSLRNIRTFSYSLEADGYSGKDITLYAGHLFAGRTIVSMAYQQSRDGTLWVVMSDGELLSCTFDPDEDVIAWTRHDTRGKFESVGTMKDDDGIDQVYFCVLRDINGTPRRFIETLADDPETDADIRDMFYVDSGLSADFIEPVASVSGLDHLNGMEVTVFADGNVITGLKVESGRVTFPDGQKYSRIHVGLSYEAELVTVELEPQEGGTLRNRPRFVVNAAIRFFRSRECWYGNSAGKSLSEMKFRTEEFDQPIHPYTGEKFVNLVAPGNARSASITLKSVDPVPFCVLGIIAEAAYGQPA